MDVLYFLGNLHNNVCVCIYIYNIHIFMFIYVYCAKTGLIIFT